MDIETLIKLLTGAVGGGATAVYGHRQREQEREDELSRFNQQLGIQQGTLDEQRAFHAQQGDLARAEQAAEMDRFLRQFSQTGEHFNREIASKEGMFGQNLDFQNLELGVNSRDRRYAADRMYERTTDAARIRGPVGGSKANTANKEAELSADRARRAYLQANLSRWMDDEERPNVTAEAAGVYSRELERALSARGGAAAAPAGGGFTPRGGRTLTSPAPTAPSNTPAPPSTGFVPRRRP